MELLRRLSLTIFLMSLVACGGDSLDGGSDGGDGGDGETPSVKIIELISSNTTVTGAEPIEINATVTKDGVAIEGDVITFTTDAGALSPLSGTARTDSSGSASITLTAGSIRGAGTVTASLPSGESSAVTFETQGDDIGVVGDINITVILVDSEGNPTDTITTSKPGKAIATINGISSPVIVTFSTTVGEIPIPTAITNDSFQASVDVFAGGSLGAGSIIANIESGESGQALFVVGSSTVKMGQQFNESGNYDSNADFIEGIAHNSTHEGESISAGGTTVISVVIVDDQGNLFNEPVDVNFSSGCTSLSIPTATLSSPITTSNGIATSTYLAKGCIGDDPINVTANAGGINLSSSTSINVLPASVGSLEFVSSTPANISILGTGSLGGSESSTVIFRVLDTNSNPVNNQVVNFSLNTDVGGIKLIPASATTDNNGLVQTVINSGTVATSVRVQAVIDGSNPVISSQSSLLVVSTGIPDQDSFTLSSDILNTEGWDRSGTVANITARLADAFNNPVPDGTAVSFTTEGGSIEPSCITVNGVCSVEWTSQYPRPEGHVLAHNVGDNYTLVTNLPEELHPSEPFNSLGQKFGGRATIIATAIGEESFPDLNGNGRFDASEMAAFSGTDVSGRAYDLKEAFGDDNEDGFYNPGETNSNEQTGGELEEFLDFDNSGDFSLNDGKYNGVLCAIPAHDGCSDTQSVNVRAQLELVMSGSHAFLTPNGSFDALADIHTDDDDDITTPSDNDADDDPTTLDVGTPHPFADDNDNIIYIAGENSGFVILTFSDLHNQPMPAGTIITFKPSVGGGATPSSYTWPNDNHNGGLRIGVGIKGSKEAKTGALDIEVTTPEGKVSSLFTPYTIIIQ